MPRPRERVCLQDGSKLDLNRLARQRFITRGARIGPVGIRWASTHWGEIASGLMTSDLRGERDGWLHIRIGSLDQWIMLIACPRHFGGRQWYFICPATKLRASVLWKPPGASRFCCRQTWGRAVAYHSQFQDATNRAHLGKARIRARLIRGLDPDEWDLPPKPKWMRWSTYNRAAERLDRYEAILDDGILALASKLFGRF